MSRTFPLAAPQARLWFLHQLDPTGWAHSSVRAFLVDGPLDVDRLQTALDTLVSRHEPLRTVFPVGPSGPRQRITPAAVLVLSTADPVPTGFDLEHGPLLRVFLNRLGPGQHLLTCHLHLLAADGWSLQVFFRDLGDAYAGRALPDLAVQYVDWAAWSAEQLTAERAAGLSRWWLEELAGYPAYLDLPDAGSGNGAGRTRSLRLSAELLAGVRDVARSQRHTVFTVLAALCAKALSGLSGHDRILLGLAVTNRDHPAVHDALGFYVTTVPLAVNLTGDPPLPELLRRVSSATARAHAHKDLPFEDIVAALSPPRRPPRSPLAQVVFAHHPTGSMGTLLLDACSVAEQQAEVSAKFELTIRVEERFDGSALVRAEFDDGLVHPRQVERLLADYHSELSTLRTEGR